MEYIQAEAREQIQLFPERLEDYIDENNQVRVMDAFVDALNMEELGVAKAQPNEKGRPMYDPRDILKLYIYGYINGVRSTRRLEKETKKNVEVIWLLKRLQPDHKTISRFRKQNIKSLKNVFIQFTRFCITQELFTFEHVGIDGTKFKAVNNKYKVHTKKNIDIKKGSRRHRQIYDFIG